MKTGVIPEEWQAVVTVHQQSVDRITKAGKLKFSKTNLKPFTDINAVIGTLNSAVNALKQQTDSETQNLLQAGRNKEIDDSNYGK